MTAILEAAICHFSCIGANMWKQWTGELVDSNSRWHVVLNADRDQPNSGRLLLYDKSRHTLWRHARLQNITVTASSLSANTAFSPYPLNLPLDDEQRQESREIFHGSLVGVYEASEIRATLNTTGGPSGTNGALAVGCVETDKPSQSDHEFTWPQFKAWAYSLAQPDCPLIFRGHEKASYRLMTSLHRVGRRDLIRYTKNDLPILSGYVSGITGRTYRLNDFHDYNNLLSLAQHHGYPTPLLDWTESPFIAAYFALRNTVSNCDTKCRIFAFNVDEFQRDIAPEHGALEVPHLILSAHRAASRDHNRALPQQSVFMLSNISEIETFITEAEEMTGKRYLIKVDLMKSEAKNALNELRFMGLTEATLFPGLDGICSELRNRFFRDND